jgi:hypothetical protein
MFWCAFIALLYFIASIIVATIANRKAIYGAAAVNYHYKPKEFNFVKFYFIVFWFCSFYYLSH